MKQNLTRKQVLIRFFSVIGVTGQNRYNWPDFFCQGTFFEVLDKGVARGPGPPSNLPALIQPPIQPPSTPSAS